MANSDKPLERDAVWVTLAVGLASYQRTLPEALLRAGMLRRLFRFGTNLEVLEPDGNNSLKLTRRFGLYRNANRVLWGVWNRLPGTGRRKLPIVATSWLGDTLVAKHIPTSTIFHGWTGLSLASLQAAKREGAVTLIENPMLHPQHWQREALAECERFGVRPANSDAVMPSALIKRREREFAICDRIIVPSEVARKSFEEVGYRAKAVVVWPGVDHRLFHPQDAEGEPPAEGKTSVFRVCYVGRAELAKGIGYLVEAWKRLQLPRAELVVVGQVRPEVQSILRDCSSHNIRLTGWMPTEKVAACYWESNVFVFPSLSEGLALVILEAMASGLPVVATTTSGAQDCVDEGKEGLIVPPRNVAALADAILWCYQHPAELKPMGKAARQKVESQFTLEHYVDRQIAMYRAAARRI